MLKKALAVFLIVCLQGLSFAGLLATVGFKMNMEYVVAKICVNRTKPKLNCKGKCYLKKSQKEAKQQKEANETTLKDVYYLVSIQEQVQEFCVIPAKLVYILQNHNKKQKGWPKSPFHPPGILS